MKKIVTILLLSFLMLLCCHSEDIKFNNLNHKSNLYGIIHGNYYLKEGDIDSVSLLEDSTFILKNKIERSEGNWFLSDSLLILKTNNVYSRECVSGEEIRQNTNPIFIKIKITEIDPNGMTIKLRNKIIKAIKLK